MPKITLPALRKSSALLTKDRSTAPMVVEGDWLIHPKGSVRARIGDQVLWKTKNIYTNGWAYSVEKITGVYPGSPDTLISNWGWFSDWVGVIVEKLQPLPSHLLEKNKPYKESDSTMNEIIKINQSTWNGDAVQTVNARELHSFLEVGKRFTTWVQDRIEKYGFIEGQDFLPILGKSIGGRPSTEYHLTLDMGKELAMVENNDKGRQARRYFIECEKRLLEGKRTELPPQFQAIQDLLNQAVEQDRRITTLEDRVGKFDGDTGYMTVLAFSRTTGLNLPKSQANDLGRKAAKLCKERGLALGYAPDERYGRVNSYPVAVLEELAA